MALVVKNLYFSYGERKVLDGVNFSIKEGSLVCLLGANGSGKSTLFANILQFQADYEGKIELDGEDLADMSTRRRAEKIAYIPQSHIPVFNYSCLEVVLMATQNSNNFFQVPGEAEKKRAEQALERVGMSTFANRGYARISGGERQLVLIARALAQGSKFLIMDEPTASLDYGNQIKILSMIRALADEGYTIFLSTHHPDQALLFSDEVILLHDGKVMAQGNAKNALSSENLSKIYSLDVDLKRLEGANLYACVPTAIYSDNEV